MLSEIDMVMVMEVCREIVLSEQRFLPRGSLRPGDTYRSSEDGWFAFVPATDPYEEAALDLRGMNHDHTGAKGYLSARGADFFFEQEQTPTRFWGVVIGRNEVFMDRDTMDDFARRLAKRGVNLVRFHDRFHHMRE